MKNNTLIKPEKSNKNASIINGKQRSADIFHFIASNCYQRDEEDLTKMKSNLLISPLSKEGY